MTEKEREYMDLKRKRATIKSQITKFSTYLDGFIVNKAALTQLRIRLEKIERSWEDYSYVQDQIEALDSTEAFVHKQQLERLEFEEAYFSIVGRARLILEENTNQQVNIEVENAAIGVVRENTVASGTSVKLPVLNLQTFEGTYEQWPMFFSTFSALVDKNSNLNNVHKFYYLQSALGPKPRKVIESLDLIEENYPRAIELLKGRFDKARLATRHHARAIFDLKPIIKESSNDLRNLTDNLKQHLEALKALKYATDTWCPLIIEWILTRVDPITAREWEEKTAPNPEYKTKEFIEFLEAKCNMLENVSALDNTKLDSEKSKKCKGVAHVTNESKLKCPICKKDHKAYQCETFKSLSVKSRLAEVHKARLCLNCLHPNHIVRDCRSSACKYCSKKHHSLLHFPNSDNENKNDKEKEVKAEVEVSKTGSVANSVVTCVPKCTNSEILLSTACVHIVDKNGKLHQARALLDNAATLNFITSDLLAKLDLQPEKVIGQVIGFSGNATRTEEIVTATIKSKVQQYSQSLKFTVVDKITSSIPESQIDISQLKLPDSVAISQLADPTFNVPQKIDLLLGATSFWNVLQKGRIQLNNKQPIFQNTKLGWILGGNFTPNQTSSTKICCLVTNDDLNEQLERFWELEKCDLKRAMTIEEAECEKHFESTTYRDKDGRFVVSLPLKGKIQELGESEHNAMKRQKSIERRFTNDSVFQQRYRDFMQEYQKMKHMELVPENEEKLSVVNYLPHHGVTREESTTTKLRVVFDASCKTSSGQSLNDLLMVGPKVQQELMEILIRFRQHDYVLIADISKMFRQIKVNQKDRSLQRILWRDDPKDCILKFELTTVTYGTASAPYLAQRCLKQLALDNDQAYPAAAATIHNDFYMDDLITGSDSVSHLQQLKQEVVKILATAGMELRKWNSNAWELLSNSKSEIPLTSKEEVKTLGIRWNPQEDMFKFKVTIPSGFCKSKRAILSTTAQIYDPLGLIGPVVVKAKLFMRRLWKLSVNWDDKLPSEFVSEWNAYKERLETMEEIQIPRQVVIKGVIEVEMHGFCDASQVAYGACIYLCSKDSTEKRTVRLLTSKSRIAPMKTISIPRLELCSAVLLAKLASKIKSVMTFSISKYVYWTDSSIVLHWIRGEPNNYKVFVANRVVEIQGLTHQEEWRHVRTKSNPADMLSRGVDPRELPHSEMWWSGPPWLQEIPDQWPRDLIKECPGGLEEKSRGKAFVTIHEEGNNLLHKFSSLSNLRRVVAYCYRFVENARKSTQRSNGPLEVEELRRSNIALVKLAQHQAFSQEIEDLSKEGKFKSVSRSSRILALNPFLDDQGILRVGGRLKNAELSYDQRFPIILPSDNSFSTLLIREKHYQYLHVGLNTLNAIIRENYWIVSARKEIRRVLRKCILCFRKSPGNVSQLMGNLPAVRVNPGRPFTHTGIDYAGPFTIKISRNKSGKAYLAVFVCLATKAVHLEVVSDLSTVAFINTLKRFVARRGKSSHLYSDNGRNFVGARNELNEWVKFIQSKQLKDKVLEFTAEQSIKWTFIPPYSPHVGGIWESAVKAAKTHLKAVINQNSLTFEELTTIFTQIEAILNSRPITPVSTDPSDLSALTPGHFLIGAPLTAIPEPNLEEIRSNRLSRFQLLSSMIQGFWKRWSREYNVANLQTRQKWKETKENPHLKIGALVLLRDDNAPPLQWRLGRITELIKGSDGLVRTVEMKTQLGLTQRAIQKISVLPLEE